VSIHVLQGEREMAGDNKTLGRFELVGIPPAPRGVPQVEVTFNIDANGIVHVSAKDLGTGKEQSIQITTSSGLSDDEIESMVQDAASHEADDRKRKELAEARNEADSLVYSVEKSVEELKDTVTEEQNADITAKIAAIRTAMEGEDVEALKSATNELTQVSHKLAEEVYKKSAAAQEGAAPEAGAEGSAEAAKGAEDDVVDADFEEVGGDKKS